MSKYASVNPVGLLTFLLLTFLASAPFAARFAFSSGLTDCCTSDPDYYKVLCEVDGFRMVEMKVPPGCEDKPHDHPQHSMYFVKPAKLFITDYDESGKSKDNGHEVVVPAGAPPIFPPGAHQVKNVGTEESHVLFIEAYPTCTPCGEVPDFISPFKVAPECYQVLAENDDFVTGMMTMKPGESDPVHHHKDHLIFVLEGEEITIYPCGDQAAAMTVPIAFGAGIPAPMSAPPFGKHSLRNTGKTTVKMLFFESKKWACAANRDMVIATVSRHVRATITSSLAPHSHLSPSTPCLSHRHTINVAVSLGPPAAADGRILRALSVASSDNIER